MSDDILFALQGYKSSISRLLVDPGSQVGSPQSSSVPCSAQANSPAPSVQTSNTLSPDQVDWNGPTPSSEFEDVDSGGDPQATSLDHPTFGSVSQNASLLLHGIPGKMHICM